MGITILIELIAIAILIYFIREYEIGCGIGVLLLVSILNVAVSFLLLCVGSALPDECYNFHDSKEMQIVALQDNAYIYRHRGEKLTYSFMYKEDDGYRSGQVDADNAIIFYSEEAKVIVQSGEFKDWYHWLYAYPTKEKHIIYVPQGTVKEEYNVDLKG